MTQNNCALCKIEITENNNTNEHIIPNSIGGKRKVRNFICIKCNSKTGEKWDSELAKIFAPFCTMFGIQKDRGEVPPLRVKTLSGIEYKQFSDGTFQPLNPKLSVIQKNENGFEISIQARTVTEAHQMLKGIQKKYELKDKSIDLLKSQIITKDSYLDEPIEHSFSFNAEKLGRSAIKTALALVSSGGIDPLVCNLAINYLVNNGEPNFGYYDCNKDLVKNREFGCPFHCVFIKAIKETGQILAYIEYFGYLRIVSCLSNSYSGENQEILYAINPMTGEEINLNIELNFTQEQVEKIYNYEMYDLVAFQNSFSYIMDKAISYSGERELNRVFIKAFDYADKFHDPSKSHEENYDIKVKKIIESLKPYLSSRIKKAP